jgi:hypothetical protein
LIKKRGRGLIAGILFYRPGESQGCKRQYIC